MTNFLIRPYDANDAASLAAVFFDAVRGTASGFYDEDQVVAWAPALPDADAFHRRLDDGRAVFVAVDGDRRPIAFGDLENDGHIDMLFCRSDWGGRGVGAAIYALIEARANELELARLFVEASEAARGPFERWGFRVICRQDLIRNGISIHNYRMEKHLG